MEIYDSRIWEVVNEYRAEIMAFVDKAHDEGFDSSNYIIGMDDFMKTLVEAYDWDSDYESTEEDVEYFIAQAIMKVCDKLDDLLWWMEDKSK